jgi:hypothetical protein
MVNKFSTGTISPCKIVLTLAFIRNLPHQVTLIQGVVLQVTEYQVEVYVCLVRCNTYLTSLTKVDTL